MSKLLVSLLVITLINYSYGIETFEYLGCFKDIQLKGRMFPLGNFWDTTNTIYNCIKYCQDNFYVYAGMEFARDCWCGNRLKDTVKYPKLPEARCNYPCTGDKAEMCGGSEALSIYETGIKAILRKSDGTELKIVNDKLEVQ